MKHLLLIVNPTSGTKKAPKHLAQIVNVFNRAGYDAHVYITSCKNDATRAVETMGAGMDLIVCCGGDGTFNETVTGIINTGLDVNLGYIPAGSTNDFASTITLESNVVAAAKQIVSGKMHEYDVGMYNNAFFTYVASFGMFTKSSYVTPQGLKNNLGHMAYVLSGITELSKIRKEHLKMVLDGEVLEDDFLFGAICNSTSIGGILTLDPNIVDMRDGKFEILLIRAPKNLQELNECVVSILNRSYDCQMITFRTASSIDITTYGDIGWTLDGEQADTNTQIHIENLRRRIKLIH